MKRGITFLLLGILFFCSACSTNSEKNNDPLESNTSSTIDKNGQNKIDGPEGLDPDSPTSWEGIIGELIKKGGEREESFDGPGSLDPDRPTSEEDIGEMIEKGGDI